MSKAERSASAAKAAEARWGTAKKAAAESAKGTISEGQGEKKGGEVMDILRQIEGAKGEGAVLVITANGVKGFSDPDVAEEHVATLNGAEFAVVRLLWTGGQAQPEAEKQSDLEDISGPIRDVAPMPDPRRSGDPVPKDGGTK